MNKYLHRLLIFLIFISASASAYILLAPDSKNSSPPPSTDTSSTTSVITTTEDIKPAVLEKTETNNTPTQQKPKPGTGTDINTVKPNPPSAPTLPIDTAAQPQPETIPVTLTIENATFQIQVAPNATVYEAMLALQQENKISFSVKNFSGLGYFVQEINGIKNNPRTGFYWTYYINNEEAKLGISNYHVKPNDLITWRFENK